MAKKKLTDVEKALLERNEYFIDILKKISKNVNNPTLDRFCEIYIGEMEEDIKEINKSKKQKKKEAKEREKK